MSESAQRWRALEELYQAALEREPAARDAFLDQACPDAALRLEVRSLLGAFDAGGELLETSALRYAPQPLEPGATIGAYRIEEAIGKGGMGEVYRATDTRLRRDVAIKVLPALYASDPEWLARFDREARLLASLQHPNLAAVYGVEERALVMELVPGPTLAERIAQGPIAWEEARAILRQIADAIAFAHEHRIIHRDLKPANVKLGDRVKVLDFGLAKAIDSSSTVGLGAGTARTPSVAFTVAGLLRGTPAYMSPEQARGEPVDERADIWALGAILLAMLEGRHPFERATVKETLAAVCNGEIDLSAAPSRARRILERCLDRDPRTRWRSARYILLALEDSAPPASSSRSWMPWIIAGLCALIAAIALFGWWRAAH